ncbi:MAG TPA: hypothetical protein GX707_14290 [Epulopiscium sp.]|nr:hypothetical protein [Candidatus Epulonipiscium sp.]
MKANTYPKNTYPRRRPSKYEVQEQQPFRKKLMEAFLTQFIICAIIVSVIFGAQLLGLPKVNESVDKVKTIITYSPSLKEIAQGAKDGMVILTDKISPKSQEVISREKNDEEIPLIIVDDEIF